MAARAEAIYDTARCGLLLSPFSLQIPTASLTKPGHSLLLAPAAPPPCPALRAV